MDRTIAMIILAAGMPAGASVSVEVHAAPEYDPPSLTIELDAPRPIILSPFHPINLTHMRMQGADPSLLPANRPTTQLDLPVFDAARPLHNDWEHSPLASITPISDGLTLGSDIRFDVGRSTALRDGGIAGAHGTIATDSPDDDLPSIAQSEGEYDLYNLALSWEAVSTEDLRVNFTSGLKAIDASINKRVSTNGTTDLQDAQRVAALPVIGTGVEWSINDRLSLSGSAQTHPINGTSSIIDVQAMTAYQFSNSVDLSVGYSLIRSSFEIGSIGTELTQEGLFARLQISF